MFTNPGDFRVVDEACGSCHDDYVDRLTKSFHATSAGIISGARTYLAGATGSSRYALEDFGYLFELLLLKATDLGLGSCWLGGSFTRSRFARAMDLQEGEIIPAVSPVGVPTKRRSVVDRVIRWGAGSKRRKPGNRGSNKARRTGQQLGCERPMMVIRNGALTPK